MLSLEQSSQLAAIPTQASSSDDDETPPNFGLPLASLMARGLLSIFTRLLAGRPSWRKSAIASRVSETCGPSLRSYQYHFPMAEIYPALDSLDLDSAFYLDLD